MALSIYTAKIVIDPNVRVRGNITYSCFLDSDHQVYIGDTVLAIEPESSLAWDAVVTDIDNEGRFIYLFVDWKSGREYPN